MTSDPTSIIKEALREFVGDGDGADEDILARHDAKVRQSATAKYRLFVRTVREITRHGESMQTPKSQGGHGDECVISPPDLRQALRDLRDGRQ